MTTDDAGTKRITVTPERFAGWIERFLNRHGSINTTEAEDAGTLVRTLIAADGAVATCRLPTTADFDTERVGLLVLRKGGFSVGVAEGTQIIAHRTGSRYLQGRTAAGGWSQQRFARRRDNQADAGFAQSGKAVEEVVLPHVHTLTRVVAGGDRAAVRTVLAQRGLEPIARLLTPAMLAVGPPRRVVLDELLAKARLIHIDLVDPAPTETDAEPTD